MTSLYSNLEAGTNGATISTSGPGSPDVFDITNTVTGGTLIYDTTHAAHGTKAAKIQVAGTSGVVALGWSTSLLPVASSGPLYTRFYFYFTANPNAKVMLLNYRGTGGGTTQRAALRL